MGANSSQFTLPRGSELTHKLSTYELPDSFTKKYVKGYSFKPMNKRRAFIAQDLSKRKMRGLLEHFKERNAVWSDRFGAKPSGKLSDLLTSQPQTSRFQSNHHHSSSGRMASSERGQASLFLTDSQPTVYLDSIEQSRLDRSKMVIESCAHHQMALDLAITGNHKEFPYMVEIVDVLPSFPLISSETVVFPHSKIPANGCLEFTFRGPDDETDTATFHIGRKSWCHAFRNIKGVSFTMDLRLLEE